MEYFIFLFFNNFVTYVIVMSEILYQLYQKSIALSQVGFVVLFMFSRISEQTLLCLVEGAYITFMTTINRCIPVAIAIYRNVFRIIFILTSHPDTLHVTFVT